MRTNVFLCVQRWWPIWEMASQKVPFWSWSIENGTLHTPSLNADNRNFHFEKTAAIRGTVKTAHSYRCTTGVFQWDLRAQWRMQSAYTCPSYCSFLTEISIHQKSQCAMLFPRSLHMLLKCLFFSRWAIHSTTIAGSNATSTEHAHTPGAVASPVRSSFIPANPRPQVLTPQ